MCEMCGRYELKARREIMGIFEVTHLNEMADSGYSALYIEVNTIDSDFKHDQCSDPDHDQ